MQVAGVALRAVVDREGLEVEADGPEAADGARHVEGRGDEQPAFPRLRRNHLAREQRVLARVARAAFHDEPLALDPGEAEEGFGGVGFAAAVPLKERAVAAREDEAGAGVALGDLDAGRHARGGLVEGDLPAPEADGAAEHDNAVDPAIVERLLRETILKRS